MQVALGAWVALATVGLKQGAWLARVALPRHRCAPARRSPLRPPPSRRAGPTPATCGLRRAYFRSDEPARPECLSKALKASPDPWQRAPGFLPGLHRLEDRKGAARAPALPLLGTSPPEVRLGVGAWLAQGPPSSSGRRREQQLQQPWWVRAWGGRESAAILRRQARSPAEPVRDRCRFACRASACLPACLCAPRSRRGSERRGARVWRGDGRALVRSVPALGGGVAGPPLSVPRHPRGLPLKALSWRDGGEATSVISAQLEPLAGPFDGGLFLALGAGMGLGQPAAKASDISPGSKLGHRARERPARDA